MLDYSNYSNHYDESQFWKLVRTIGNKLPFIRNMLAMFFCMKDPSTPVWVKGMILGALGYFVLPIDLIPDFAPIVGYIDDAGVIAVVFATIHLQIKEEHWVEADIALGRGHAVGNS